MKIREFYNLIENLSKELNIEIEETTIFLKVSNDMDLATLHKSINLLKNVHIYLNDSCTLEIKKEDVTYSTESGFKDFEKAFEELEGQISFTCLVEKHRLLDIWCETSTENRNVHLVYGINYLYSILGKPFCEIEKLVFKDKTRKAIIILCDRDVTLQNGYLCIVGNETDTNRLNSIDDTIVDTNTNDIERRDSECNYENRTTWLTPRAFYFDIETKDDVWQVLSYKYLGLCLAFIANVTRMSGTHLLITIRAYKKVLVEYPLDSLRKLVFNLRQVKIIHMLYEWIYSPGSITDKLGILRNLISLYLDDSQKENLKIFVEKSEPLYSSAKSNYQIYLKENVTLYLSERKKIEDTISQSVNQIRTKAENILDKLSTSLFGAVAVGIGFLVSYVIKPDMNPAVVKYGFFIYGLVVFVTGTVNLIFSRHSFRNVKEGLENMLNSYMEIFSEDDLQRITQNTPKHAYKFFNRYWWLTLVLYFALAAVLAITALKSETLIALLYVPAN